MKALAAVIILFLFCSGMQVKGQETSVGEISGAASAAMNSLQAEMPLSLNGYINVMQSMTFDSLSGPFLNENLLHNRLNFKWYLNDNITAALELRNRLFTGDMVRMGKPYSDMIGSDPGVVDMSWNLFSEQSFLLNTTLDRLWLDFRFNRLQVTIGRQRINWGQTLVWNPNDIFNTYSFFDFDYPERPGSDAMRVQFFTSSAASAEMAVKFDGNNDVTAAGLYRFNSRGYDIQFLAGINQGKDIVAGTGWSGAIGNLAFRGEASLFAPVFDSTDEKSTVLVTTSLEKIFRDNSMAQFQLMYCNNPFQLNGFESFYSAGLSARDLAFSKLSLFGQGTWAATPLLSIYLSAMLFPGLKGYFTGPGLEYSLGDNLGFTLIWQHFNAEIEDTNYNINIAFLRLKYSF
jgi:hypothetical protein